MISVTATCVRVPVLNSGHSESINIEFDNLFKKNKKNFK